MLVKNQIVEVKSSNKSKKYYMEKGYRASDDKNIFLIKVEDLNPNSHIKVKAICDYCKKEYDVEWRKYIEAEESNKKHACYSCKTLKKWENDLGKRQDELYNKAINICEKNGYIFISEKDDIKNNTTYVKYICPIHGVHEMRINNLINGKGCPECSFEDHRRLYQLSPDEVERRIQFCGGILLNKDDYKNQIEKNLYVICPECGEAFTTSLRNFTQHGSQVCDKCSGVESVGEKRIRHYLENHNISFIPQKWFPDCRDINPLPFDFYLMQYNMIIEYDGRQHFEDTGYFSYSLKMTQRHDKIKNEYCEDNNIKLIRIPYWDYNKIEEILDKNLISHEDIV